jgi:hypothetical protein
MVRTEPFVRQPRANAIVGPRLLCPELGYRIVAFAIARPTRARQQKQSCRAEAAHAWIWAWLSDKPQRVARSCGESTTATFGPGSNRSGKAVDCREALLHELGHETAGRAFVTFPQGHSFVRQPRATARATSYSARSTSGRPLFGEALAREACCGPAGIAGPTAWGRRVLPRNSASEPSSCDRLQSSFDARW